MAAKICNRVLVADDDACSCKLKTTLLHADGYEVRATESGTGALKTIAEDRPDILLLDLLMPGMSGFKVDRWIPKACLEELITDGCL